MNAALSLSSVPVVNYPFDWLKPDYHAVNQRRSAMLLRVRKAPGGWQALKDVYREDPVRLVADWGMTYDPRNPPLGLPAIIPLVLFPRQVDWCYWFLERFRRGERGLTEKSRECGVTWLACGMFDALALTLDGISLGIGSRKKELVDDSEQPDCLFWKLRFFLEKLPPELRGGYVEALCSRNCRLAIPETGATITGEGGDDIGRGGRKAAYLVDEAAFLEHPESVEGSLSENTNCRIDVSTPSGPAGSFAERRRSLPAHQIFTFHYRDDPRKGAAWLAQRKINLTSSTFAREHDISYAESIDRIVIPADWVEAAIGAAAKLGIEISGARTGGLDVMDQGQDLNAFVGRYGISVNVCESWTGKAGDINETTIRAMDLCARNRLTSFVYDAVGVGAGCRGDARVYNERRHEQELDEIGADPFFGSGEVFEPDDILDSDWQSDRLNKDYYANLKAQCWWWLRLKFQATWRALHGQPYDPTMLISIDLPPGNELTTLTLELAQPTYGLTATGKLLVNKAPEGARSPNHADALVICMAPINKWMDTWMRLV